MRLNVILPAIACGLLLLNGSIASAQTRPPNIVVIVSDDMGYADIGPYGGKDIPTPNLDALAESGIRFTNAYVSGPYCSPTRAGLLTGRYPQRYGHEFNPGGRDPNFGLPTAETTLADRLKAAGYRTALIGKWHLGFGDKFHPLARGFDEFFGFLGGAHSYFHSDVSSPNAILDGRKPVAEIPYLTEAFADRAVDFIKRNRSQPFFLYLAFNAVHMPMHTTAQHLKRVQHIADHDRRTYAAMLVAMDDGIGKTIDALRAEKLDDNTLLIFLNDNGGPPVTASSNGPLRGWKLETYEGGIRVPFIISWKGRLRAGAVDARPIIQLDVMPTALAAAGIALDSAWKLDGVNLLPFLTGQASGEPHDALYWRLGQEMAIRKGSWKLVQSSDREVRAVNRNRPRDLSKAELYNLEQDIGERTNLAAEYPEKVKELADAWLQWNRQLAKPLWGDGAMRSAVRSEFLEKTMSVNGTPLTYSEEGSGTPVIFLHGSFSDRRVWEPQRAAIAGKYRFIALTMRYFGTAPWPDRGENFSQATHIEDAAAFIRQLNAGPAFVVGRSYGAVTALGVALQHPELVRGLFLNEPGVPAAVTDTAEQRIMSEEERKRIAAVEPALKTGNVEEATRQFFDFVNDLPGAFDALPPAARAIHLDNARTVPLRRPPFTLSCGKLGEIKVPVTITQGQLTRPLFRISAQAVSRCIPGSRLVVIEGARHAAPSQNSSAFNQALLSFLGRQQ